MPRSNSYQRGIVVPIDAYPIVDVDVNGVPDDTTVLDENCRGLVARVAGVINVVMQGGVVRTGYPLIAGINPGYFAEVRDSTAHTDPAAAIGIWQIV